MLKRYTPLGESSSATRSRAIVGLSFALLALLGSSFFLYSLTMKHQNAHAAKPAATSSVGKTWYLAEGRVGGGFREFITIGNPDPTTDCTANITYMPEGDITDAQAKRHMAASKPLAVRTVSIPHASRYTASVVQDLGISEQQQPGILLSAVVTVPATSGCAGVVVERPMYFNYHGVVSGSDILGTTTLAQTFYLADVPTQVGATAFVTSYITALNPSTSTSATVTVSYYAKGAAVETQTLYIAPGARGTIYPGTLPYSHVSAVVTASTPVAVERSTYTHGMQEGNAGVVSNAASIVASQALSNDWLFAEGYTGGQYQENMVLSNLSNAAITATITLEYQNGHNQVVTVPVPAFTQVIQDVNALNTNPTGTCDVTPCTTTPEVSAEVTASAASLVVERQMSFRYTHTLPNTSINVTTVGGSDVMGALAVATNVANFAEGYTNAGYNEWITLQNPTATQETLAVITSNEYGRSYTANIPVSAKSRQTVDITDIVRKNLVQSGDDYRTYQVSVSVHATAGNTFVAERPMYFNTAQGNQGGSDVVGFTGITSTLPVNTITNFSVLTANSSLVGMAQGSDGNVWFTEQTGNKIGVITPAGVTTEFTVPTPTSTPTDITKGPDGNMWFVENTGNKIGSITPSGNITEYSNLLSPASGLTQITAGPDGNLWFTENSAGKIGKIVPATGVITEYSTGITTNSHPYGIVAGPDSNIWFTEASAGKIGKIVPATSVITEYNTGITLNSTPNGITVGSDSNLWFTEAGAARVGSITPAGVITEHPTTNATSDGITAGPDGNLWFTEQGTGKVGRITTVGVDTEFTIPGVSNTATTRGITVGADGNIWFAENSENLIGRIVLG